MKYFTSKFLLLVFNCLSKICIAALNLTSIFNSKCTHIFSTPYIGFETTGFIHFNYIYVLKLLSFKGTRVSSWFRHNCLYRWTKNHFWARDLRGRCRNRSKSNPGRFCLCSCWSWEFRITMATRTNRLIFLSWDWFLLSYTLISFFHLWYLIELGEGLQTAPSISIVTNFLGLISLTWMNWRLIFASWSKLPFFT